MYLRGSRLSITSSFARQGELLENYKSPNGAPLSCIWENVPRRSITQNDGPGKWNGASVSVFGFGITLNLGIQLIAYDKRRSIYWAEIRYFYNFANYLYAAQASFRCPGTWAIRHSIWPVAVGIFFFVFHFHRFLFGRAWFIASQRWECHRPHRSRRVSRTVARNIPKRHTDLLSSTQIKAIPVYCATSKIAFRYPGSRNRAMGRLLMLYGTIWHKPGGIISTTSPSNHIFVPIFGTSSHRTRSFFDRYFARDRKKYISFWPPILLGVGGDGHYVLHAARRNG